MHAPPLTTDDWDESTIESQMDQAETDDSNKSASISEQQQRKRDGFEHGIATAQALAIMKPWIERAALQYKTL